MIYNLGTYYVYVLTPEALLHALWCEAGVGGGDPLHLDPLLHIKSILLISGGQGKFGIYV